MARVLSSCGFNNWSFSRLFSASLGYYSPLLSCKSQSVNAFRQIDSSVLEVCDNCSTLSAPCSLSPNLSNSVVHSVMFEKLVGVISGRQVSFLYY